MYLLIVVFGIVSAILIALLHRPARWLGLVDHPGGRKAHDRVTPLTGGIAIYLTFLVGVWVLGVPDARWLGLALAGGLLLLVGLLDDLQELSAKSRFIAQILAALILFWIGRAELNDLGRLAGEENVGLGALALPFTVFCVVGVINATNMMDGLDGLAGSQLLLFFGVMALLAMMAGLPEEEKVLMVLCGALLGFLALNFRFRCKRPALTFLGDAGSLFLGLAAAWFLIKFTQEPIRVISPITAVWLFSLPLMDTVAIMIRRVLHGRSPFAPDRDHFHHVLLAAGFGVRTTVLIIITISALLSGVGLYAEYVGVSQHVMFLLFLLLFMFYFWGMMHAWRVMKFLHRLHGAMQRWLPIKRGV